MKPNILRCDWLELTLSQWKNNIGTGRFYSNKNSSSVYIEDISRVSLKRRAERGLDANRSKLEELREVWELVFGEKPDEFLEDIECSAKVT